VGLQKAFEAAVAQTRRAPFGADDSGGHRLADAERVAHGQRHVPYAHAIGISQGEHRQVFGVDLEHGQIAARIIADEFRVVTSVVRHLDPDLLGAVNHVMVGQNVSVFSDNHARTEAALNLLAWGGAAGAVPEEVTEKRVLEERELLGGMNSPAGTNGHARRRDAIDPVSVGDDRGARPISRSRWRQRDLFVVAAATCLKRKERENRQRYPNHRSPSKSRFKSVRFAHTLYLDVLGRLPVSSIVFRRRRLSAHLKLPARSCQYGRAPNQRRASAASGRARDQSIAARARYCQHTRSFSHTTPFAGRTRGTPAPPRPMSPIRLYRAAPRIKGQRLNRRPAGANEATVMNVVCWTVVTPIF